MMNWNHDELFEVHGNVELSRINVYEHHGV